MISMKYTNYIKRYEFERLFKENALQKRIFQI